MQRIYPHQSTTPLAHFLDNYGIRCRYNLATVATVATVAVILVFTPQKKLIIKPLV